jgi:hypothetical protein
MKLSIETGLCSKYSTVIINIFFKIKKSVFNVLGKFFFKTSPSLPDKDYEEDDEKENN